MRASSVGRRRSDLPDFVQTNIDIDALAAGIFARYVGPQSIVIEGTPSVATFFNSEYCPDLRVMKLAGELALRVNQRAVAEADVPDGIDPLRVTIREIMLAALLHDLGKQHEDCAPFIELLRERDLRGDTGEDAAQRAEYLLGIVRDVHCRKGPCMIDRLRDAGRAELNNPFIATVARRHGEDYATNSASARAAGGRARSTSSPSRTTTMRSRRRGRSARTARSARTRRRRCACCAPGPRAVATIRVSSRFSLTT